MRAMYKRAAYHETDCNVYTAGSGQLSTCRREFAKNGVAGGSRTCADCTYCGQAGCDVADNVMDKTTGTGIDGADCTAANCLGLNSDAAPKTSAQLAASLGPCAQTKKACTMFKAFQKKMPHTLCLFTDANCQLVRTPRRTRITIA